MVPVYIDLNKFSNQYKLELNEKYEFTRFTTTSSNDNQFFLDLSFSKCEIVQVFILKSLVYKNFIQLFFSINK